MVCKAGGQRFASEPCLFQGNCEVACDVLSELERSSITKEILEVIAKRFSPSRASPSSRRHPRPRLGRTDGRGVGRRTMRLSLALPL